MSRWGDLAFDVVRGALNSIREAAQFVLGLSAVIIVTMCGQAAAILHELIKYKDIPVDWMQMSLLIVPPLAVAIPGFILHKQAVDKARAEMPPGGGV